MQPDAARRRQVALWPTRMGPTPSSEAARLPSLATSAGGAGERGGLTLRTTALSTQQGSDAAEATPEQPHAARSSGRARRVVMDPQPWQGAWKTAFQTQGTGGAAHRA